MRRWLEPGLRRGRDSRYLVTQVEGYRFLAAGCRLDLDEFAQAAHAGSGETPALLPRTTALSDSVRTLSQMRSGAETWVVRAGTLVLASAAIAPALMDSPAKLPSVALESELLLYVERGVAFLRILLFVLVVVVRGCKGDLPIALSQQGAEWADAAGATTRVLEAQLSVVQAQVDALAAALQEVSEIAVGRRDE